MPKAYLGLGSNLGDREDYLRRAIEALDGTPGIRVSRESSFVETEPVGITAQPKFLNAVIEIETGLEPRELLSVVKETEARLGRRQTFRWGPREIDIDILLYDEIQVDEPGLQIPHPRMHEREFVLGPLREIAPEKVP